MRGFLIAINSSALRQGESRSPRGAIGDHAPFGIIDIRLSVLISPVQLGIGLDIRATSKMATTVPYPVAPLLALGILLAPVTASADQLCGRQFDSLSQLYADLRSEAD